MSRAGQLAASAIGSLFVAGAALVGACDIEGVTPNCSDAGECATLPGTSDPSGGEGGMSGGATGGTGGTGGAVGSGGSAASGGNTDAGGDGGVGGGAGSGGGGTAGTGDAGSSDAMASDATPDLRTDVTMSRDTGLVLDVRLDLFDD